MSQRQPPGEQSNFELFAAKMLSANMPELAVSVFKHYYDQLLAGATGYIGHHDAQPVQRLLDSGALNDNYDEAGFRALDQTVVLKLNGGLGTSMGLSGPKSLLPVKDGLTFLDITIRQVMHMRRETGVRLPLVLMNSYNTHCATLDELKRYPDFRQDIPVGFLQSKKPKIWKDTLKPVSWPADPDKEWCPPGHGDIYLSLLTSGILDQMLDAGYKYMFVSNSDNLGAVLDTKILGYFVCEESPFLMEVADRTPADRKGGHLSRRPDGQLILREISQCPPQEMEMFQDINRYRYFNTNNLWLHLPTLREVMQQHGDMLELPLIRNEKPVDPTNPGSPRVYQLETAMGSAIARFEGATALRVPRFRFVPIKTNDDLLLLWSDVYELTADFQVRLTSARSSSPPLVQLDDRFYQMIEDLKRRFPHGAPSMLQCTSLRLVGDIHFGSGIVLEGAVDIVNRSDRPLYIPDGIHIRGD